MIKTYKANTNVSINVVLASKKNLHISFTPLSNGSSTFTTDNEEVMNAIERHYNFGKLFRLHSTQGESKKKAAKVVENPVKEDNPTPAETTTKEAETTETHEPADNEGGSEQTTTVDAETEDTDNEAEDAEAPANDTAALKQVTVSDLASAKDYLADKFDISRTSLRSKKAIVEQAAAHGIEFVGLS